MITFIKNPQSLFLWYVLVKIIHLWINIKHLTSKPKCLCALDLNLQETFNHYYVYNIYSISLINRLVYMFEQSAL